MHQTKTEELIRKFNSLQETRVAAYQQFECGIKAYLNSAPHYDFETYRDVVHKVTQEFLSISEKIIALKKEAQEIEADTVTDIISKIQQCEKKKLELTAEEHLARQMVIDTDNGELEINLARDIKQKLGHVIEEINDNLSELRYLQ